MEREDQSKKWKCDKWAAGIEGIFITREKRHQSHREEHPSDKQKWIGNVPECPQPNYDPEWLANVHVWFLDVSELGMLQNPCL